jgi:hypothetical protein
MKASRDVAREIEKVTSLETLLKQQQQQQQGARPLKSAPATDTNISLPVSQSTGNLESGRRLSGQKLTSSRSGDGSDALKDEITHLQSALVDKFRGNQKLVSGAQFRSVSRDPGRCESCESKENLLKKSKENIRSLKFQLRQLEDKLGASTTKKFSRTGSENFDLGVQSLSAGAFDELREANDTLRRTIIELEQGNSLLNSMMMSERRGASDKEDTLLRAVATKDEIIVALRAELVGAKRNEKEAIDALGSLKSQFQIKVDYANDLEEELATLRNEVNMLRKKCAEADSNAERWQIAANVCQYMCMTLFCSAAMIEQLEQALSEARLKINTINKDKDDLKAANHAFEIKLSEALAKLSALESDGDESASELAAARQQVKV